MDIRTQATLLAAIVTLALAAAALLRDNRSRVFTLFALFSADLFLFSLALFFLRWKQSFGTVWWERLAVGTGALIPAAALAFFLEFLGVARRPARRARNAMLAGSLTGLVVAITPLVHVKPAKLLVGAYVLGGLAAVLSTLWGKRHGSQTRVERARLQYLFVGALVAVVLSTLDMLPLFGVPYPPEGLGSIVLTVFMFFLSQTLQRHRLLDLHEFLGKIVVVTALGLVLVAIYGGLVSWVGDRPELFYFNTVVASFVILSLFDPMRDKVEEWVVATLFHERYELVRRLEDLRDRTGKVIEPAGLAAVVLDGLVETRRVTHCSLWLLADDRPGYRLLDYRGPPPAPFLEPATARALLGASSSGQKAILAENIDRRVSELRALLPTGPGDHVSRRGAPAAIAEELKRLGDARAVMGTMRAGIAMPLLAGDRVVGFLACWDERVQEAFASDEIAALIEVADRCALVIENSKLYQQMKERDRLAALGEMSAGLAHEIRNPLAAIKAAIQYLDPRKVPEDDREFFEIVVEEVNRLNGVVTQFLDYSRPLKPSLAPTQVNEVLEKTFKLLQAEVPESVRLELELAEWLPRVQADAEQLKQVFLNLALNAFQAMPRGGRLTVSTKLARDELAFWREGARRADVVEIRFRDTGPGIPDDARESIFVPFYTTKEKGTGLGLAICQRIVKAQQGTIVVRSAPGEGAEFLIALPGLHEERPAEAPRPPLDEEEKARARERRRARAEARLRGRRRRKKHA
ncbi:signal transduction histidine kinase, nitrogen specific, NtrB [Anaeromyxobacter dehalogenans 2CP-1]|uniref:histidine kinase n=1 Tax=Anaeromyxobacter dehalogenans (strain ATCC BAA-258 / DSM 21875 / 2CP-1) TaxID=455488 RepID=B8J899_ANAD2|nr:sensor histidine kinase [Anaeromyxobacter dehalogenans]ACL65398.1 signal transduction histidine kinase, nitrogen specific, NtrB [Anaeromyxobacter dehalogenans 2CP-1]